MYNCCTTSNLYRLVSNFNCQYFIKFKSFITLFVNRNSNKFYDNQQGLFDGEESVVSAMNHIMSAWHRRLLWTETNVLWPVPIIVSSGMILYGGLYLNGISHMLFEICGHIKWGFALFILISHMCLVSLMILWFSVEYSLPRNINIPTLFA